MIDSLGTVKVKTTNGEYKEADVLNTFNMDNNDYIIYSLDNGDETSNIYASRLIVDEEGNPTFFDINSVEKAKIIKYIQELIAREA